MYTILDELWHTHEPPPLHFENLCETVIINDILKQYISKAMDMHIYWLRCCSW